MANKDLKDKIREKIIGLRKEIQVHQARLQQAQQVVNIESQQILAKQGAIEALQELVGIKDKQKA